MTARQGEVVEFSTTEEAAVDAIDKTIEDFPSTFHGSKFADGRRKFLARDILDALLSPTEKPCAECGGEGKRPTEITDGVMGGWKPCSICHGDGFVSSPAPIEGLGWVKGSDCEPITVSNDDGAGGQFVDAEGNYESYDRPATRRVIGFILPSKVREG